MDSIESCVGLVQISFSEAMNEQTILVGNRFNLALGSTSSISI